MVPSTRCCTIQKLLVNGILSVFWPLSLRRVLYVLPAHYISLYECNINRMNQSLSIIIFNIYYYFISTLSQIITKKIKNQIRNNNETFYFKMKMAHVPLLLVVMLYSSRVKLHYLNLQSVIMLPQLCI